MLSRVQWDLLQCFRGKDFAHGALGSPALFLPFRHPGHPFFIPQQEKSISLLSLLVNRRQNCSTIGIYKINTLHFTLRWGEGGIEDCVERTGDRDGIFFQLHVIHNASVTHSSRGWQEWSLNTRAVLPSPGSCPSLSCSPLLT